MLGAHGAAASQDPLEAPPSDAPAAPPSDAPAAPPSDAPAAPPSDAPAAPPRDAPAAPPSDAPAAPPRDAPAAPPRDAPAAPPRDAPAAPPRDAPAEAELRHHRIAAHLGLNGPLGFGGLAYTYSDGRRFQVEGGVGGGVTGLHLSVMPMLVWGTPGALSERRFHLGLGVAWTPVTDSCGNGGDYMVSPSGQVVSPPVRPCLWVNAEAGWEWVGRSGFSTVLAGGVSAATERVQWGGMFLGADIPAFLPLPYVRIGLGVWLDGPSPPRPPGPPPPPPEPEQPARHHRVAGSFGSDGLQMGRWELAYTFAPWDWLRVKGGADLSTVAAGPIAAVQLALGSRRHRFVAGAGGAWLWMRNREMQACRSGCLELLFDIVGYELVLRDGFTASVGLGSSRLARRTEKLRYDSNIGQWETLSPSLHASGQAHADLGWWF